MRRQNHEFAGRLGDLPEDYARPPNGPGNQINGFDTTGSKNGQRSQAAYNANQALSNTPYAAFAAGLVLLIGAVQNKANVNQSSFTASNAEAILLRPQEDRIYFAIQNISVLDMYLGIGYAPTPDNGLILAPGLIFEPFRIPQAEIYVLGFAAAQNGVILYANG